MSENVNENTNGSTSGINLESHVRQAFDAIERPSGLDSKTLAHIEARRNAPTPKRVKKSKVALGAIAACLALALVSAGIWNLLGVPIAYAEIQSDAAVQLTLNRINRVIGAEALNQSGQKALDELHSNQTDLAGMTYGEALNALTSTAPYVNESAAAVEITLACGDEECKQRLQNESEECMSGRQYRCQDVSMEDHGQKRAQHRYRQGSE